MPLPLEYGYIDESRAHHFNMYEIFDVDKLMDELNNIAIEIESLSFDITVKYKKRPQEDDIKYKKLAYMWALVCEMRNVDYRLEITGSYYGIYFSLYHRNGDWIDRDLLKYVFGNPNRHNVFTKDIYNAKNIVKDFNNILKQV